jgi:hypothetical protein
MRDRMDAEIWNASHDRFSEWLDHGIAAAGAALRRTGTLAGRVPGQVLATLLAVGVTFAAFGASAV